MTSLVTFTTVIVMWNGSRHIFNVVNAKWNIANAHVIYYTYNILFDVIGTHPASGG